MLHGRGMRSKTLVALFAALLLLFIAILFWLRFWQTQQQTVRTTTSVDSFVQTDSASNTLPNAAISKPTKGNSALGTLADSDRQLSPPLQFPPTEQATVSSAPQRLIIPVAGVTDRKSVV